MTTPASDRPVRLHGTALRVTIFIGENDTWHHKPLYSEEDRVRAFLPGIDELVTEGLVILDACEVIRYVGRQRGPRADGGEA